MTKRIIIGLSIILSSNHGFCQSDEELTPVEIAYRDSIALLNADNARTSASQEAYNEGINLFEQKKFKESIGKFDLAIKGDTLFQFAFYNKGIAQIEIKKYAEAISTFTALIKLNDEHEMAYFNRARAYQESKYLTEAIADYNQVLFFNPKNEISLKK